MRNTKKRKTTNKSTVEVNWTGRTFPLETFKTIMIKVTKTKMEMLVMVLFMFTTCCGRILKIIFSYQTYQITTVVHIVLRKAWRSSFKLLLNELFLPVVCSCNTSVRSLRSQKDILGCVQLEASLEGSSGKTTHS